MGRPAVGSLRLASALPPGAAKAMLAPLVRFGAAQVPVRRGWLPLVDERFVRTAHRARLHVHVWTVDDESTMVRLLDLGVDGIMTDRPTVLKAVLDGGDSGTEARQGERARPGPAPELGTDRWRSFAGGAGHRAAWATAPPGPESPRDIRRHWIRAYRVLRVAALLGSAPGAVPILMIGGSK